ncbi:MAG: hypothetical protein J5I90_19080 [Caldilineales bacterium]|nr:hypothetical protein [Caldilineales bacterium]
MKTVLQLLVILLAVALVAGSLYLLVENTNLANILITVPAGNASAAVSDRVLIEMPERPEGAHEGEDHHSTSLTQGLADVCGSLAKISLITVFILFVQFVIARLQQRRRWMLNFHVDRSDRSTV